MNLLFDLTLTVRSPVLCHGLSQTALGIDASFIRDERGRPILPADHIKGLLRRAIDHRWPALADDLFGAPSEASSRNQPSRGIVFLTDLFADVQGEASTATRIMIDPDSGTTVDGALQVLELIAAIGAPIQFTGQLLISGLDERKLTEAENALRNSLESIGAVGAMKSIGFGEVIQTDLTLRQQRAAASLPEADHLEMDVTFDRPIVVGSDRPAANVFRSGSVLPGSVVKGALATALERAGDLDTALSEDLSAVRISHGFPLDPQGLPMERTPPRSLVAADGLVGCAVWSMPDQGALLRDEAPKFLQDWKANDWHAVQTALGWSSSGLAPLVQRTRAAMDDSGVAADGQLFVYQAAPSLRPDGSAQRWRLTLHRGQASETGWKKICSALAVGLPGIGKTDAFMTIDGAGPATPLSPPPPLIGADGERHWAVTMETPALMLDPGQGWDASAQYQAYWAWALKCLGYMGETRLANWFTGETLHGGYEAVRRGLFGAEAYGALVLTAPGSVFLLKDGPGLGVAIARALRQGLPPRPPAKSGRSALTWRDTVFVPENGYGAIALYHEAHRCLSSEVTLV